MNCKRIRRVRLFYVNMSGGDSTKRPEWDVRECGNRLEGEAEECPSCERGWSIRDNHFIEDSRKFRKASDEIRRTSTVTVSLR